ncbi:rhomboid family intramembrane serine protease [Virgibacillus ihumii]|uniref:rhomboid family intramembrane serine protease n=1 Tax=Virgibacillus ihumii TaxID=2686091 RepID=UPI00157CF949|nr:rhomboid family intramembrane serine protease [Virgibacillus ihumii]
MYLYEQYTMYKLAYSLVEKDGFEIIHINENEEELWLEKYENKKSSVVRFVHRNFQWSNQLKRDIAAVFQKTKALKRFLQGKKVEIHNVYIAGDAPVDEWELLKKPMQLNEKHPMHMHVYYLTDDAGFTEKKRLREALGSSGPIADNEDLDIEEQVNFYKARLKARYQNRKQEDQDVFSRGKPLFTYILLVINILIFMMLELNGGSTNTKTLIEFGAKYNPAIIENNEWWRIITSMFLHIGPVHLFMNMLAVYFLGVAVERIYGSWRFIFIYFLSGIGGGLASFAFTTHVSAGASGALFGLFGALLFFGLIHKRIFNQTMGKNLLIIIVINIVFGFTVPSVDMGAHIGGLITGFVASAIVHLPANRKLLVQLPAFILYAVIIFLLIIFGVRNNLHDPVYLLMKTEQLVQNKQFNQTIDVATKGLAYESNVKDQLLFQRSYAYIQLNKIERAKKDLKLAVSIDEDYIRAHYNLAIIYYNNNNLSKAKEHITKAYELKQDNPEIELNVNDLYEEITGKQAE